MGWWSDQVLPRATDLTMNAGEIHKLRRRVCAGLDGEVLEIGFGSGLNAQHYPDAVARVSAVEPSGVAWHLAQTRRLPGTDTTVVRAGLDGQELDLPDASFDHALSTFSLCTIPDVDLALREVARVLKPGGTLHFLEHGLAPDARVVRWQRRFTPMQRRVAGGCHLDRPIPDLIGANGLVVGEMDTFYFSRPKLLSYLYLGSAAKP